MPLNTTLITLTPPSFLSGYCPTSYQALANDIIAGTQATFNSSIGNSFFNYGSITPSTDNRIYPWLDMDGNWWVWVNAKWSRRHPIDPTSGASVRQMWVGDPSALNYFDGGDGTSIVGANYNTGPMWQIDSEFAAKFPVGVGTFADSGTTSVAESITSTGVSGEDKHLLIGSEIPEHSHVYTSKHVTQIQALDTGATFNGDMFEATPKDSFISDGPEYTSSKYGDGKSHNNLPPFYGVYFIKRSSRIWYTK